MTSEAAPRDRSINRGIIWAALRNSGYSSAQAETRIIEFEKDVRAEAAAGTALDLLQRLVAVVDAGHIWWDEPVPQDSMAALHDAKVYLARLAGVDSDRQPVADASEDGA